MKVRNRPKEHHVILTMAALVILTLLGIHTVWPDAFGVFVAVAGAIGALVVLYEVRLTKRIAQAEFIRDLQTGFSSDENIGALWRKLLLKEPIPVEDRAHVFTRFWRGDASRTRHTGGAGLGLAIVSSIVAAHGGTSEVISQVGYGTTIRVRLPAKVP